MKIEIKARVVARSIGLYFLVPLMVVSTAVAILLWNEAVPSGDVGIIGVLLRLGIVSIIVGGCATLLSTIALVINALEKDSSFVLFDSDKKSKPITLPKVIVNKR